MSEIPRKRIIEKRRKNVERERHSINPVELVPTNRNVRNLDANGQSRLNVNLQSRLFSKSLVDISKIESSLPGISSSSSNSGCKR